MIMYQLNRALWFAVAGVAFVTLMALTWSAAPWWAWGSWAALFGLFGALIEPTPRLYERDPRKDRYDVVCDCPRCPGEDGVVNGEGEVDGW